MSNDEDEDEGIEISKETRDLFKKAKKNQNKSIEDDIKNDIKRNIRKKKHLKMKQEEEIDDVLRSFEDRINKRLKLIEDAGEEDHKEKDDKEFEDVEVEDM